jgi:hypothetical protein
VSWRKPRIDREFLTDLAFGLAIGVVLIVVLLRGFSWLGI